MSSGDKILNRISLDCDERISKIGAETDEKCAQIMAQAKLDADKISAEIADRAQSKVKQMQAASKSRCDLETRNAFLKRRREEIDKTYSEILNKMKNLPDEDYFELIHSEEKMCGGFIWEWCDHAIDMGKTIEGKKMYAYGGDHNEYPHDGNFCMDGLVYPDRTPHTGLMEFKNVYRPVRVTGYDAEKGTLTIKNYMNFVNLKDYAVLGLWTVK